MFFLVVWALYTIRHAYAKLTQAYAEWQVAYAVVFCLGLLTRVVTRGLFCQQIWRSQLWNNFGYCPATWPFVASFPFFCLLWLHFLSFWPFVASFTFILALCAFHKSVWFVLLRDQWLLPSYLRKRGGPMAGAISCLRGAYAEVTQRLRGGSW